MKTKTTLLVTAALALSALTSGAGESGIPWARQRTQMVETQLKSRGIQDPRVIQAMLTVQRHRFVPARYRNQAYEDHPLPIGEGQTISQPYVVALMTELLALKGGERVLEIGTGSGYQTAILAELAKEVYSIELLAPLARRAKTVLRELDYNNVHLKSGDGFLGWPEFAPFDGIIVTCAPEKIPDPLLAQLAENGSMVIPVGTSWQKLTLVRKRKGTLSASDIAPVRFVPMRRERGLPPRP